MFFFFFQSPILLLMNTFLYSCLFMTLECKPALRFSSCFSPWMTERLFGGQAFDRVFLQHVPDEVLRCRNQKKSEFNHNYSQGNKDLCLNNLYRSWSCNTADGLQVAVMSFHVYKAAECVKCLWHTWLRDVVPVRRVESILCLPDFGEQARFVLLVKRRVAAQPKQTHKRLKEKHNWMSLRRVYMSPDSQDVGYDTDRPAVHSLTVRFLTQNLWSWGEIPETWTL